LPTDSFGATDSPSPISPHQAPAAGGVGGEGGVGEADGGGGRDDAPVGEALEGGAVMGCPIDCSNPVGRKNNAIDFDWI
jgi:hypothetical protein